MANEVCDECWLNIIYDDDDDDLLLLFITITDLATYATDTRGSTCL